MPFLLIIDEEILFLHSLFDLGLLLVVIGHRGHSSSVERLLATILAKRDRIDSLVLAVGCDVGAANYVQNRSLDLLLQFFEALPVQERIVSFQAHLGAYVPISLFDDPVHVQGAGRISSSPCLREN